MTKVDRTISFDAKAALKAATLAIIGISSSWKYSLQEDDRNEIIACTLEKAWSRRDSYDPGKASFSTWIGRIARNTLLDFIRRKKPVQCISSLPPYHYTAKSPETLMMEAESIGNIASAINSLPTKYRSILTLVSQGMELEDVASSLGCTVNAATVRCHRARMALREKLGHRMQ